jgi:predicted dehydrogenase
MEKPNLLLIGKGRWGSVIQKNLEALEAVGQVFTATRDWREYLTKGDIAGVIITTPPHTHTEIALAFIEKGIPVFIEKPMTLSSSEAHQIIGASENAGVPVQVGHIHLYNGAYISLKAALKAYGPIRYIDTEASNFGPYRPDYSVIWDYASHDVSMVLDILQESPNNVTASAQALTDAGTRNWDISNLFLSFPSGITANIGSSRISPIKVRGVTVVCEKATIVYDDTLPEKKLAVYEGLTPESLKALGAEKAVLGAIYPEYDITSPLMVELQEFVGVVTHKKKPTCDALFGANIVNVLEQAEAAITT